MRKFLYIMPAVLFCMLYALLAVWVGGIGDFGFVAYAYIILPILAGILLRKGKWWGCLLGMTVGGMMAYFGMTAQPQVFAGFVIGLILAAYYVAMGLVCAASQEKT